MGGASVGLVGWLDGGVAGVGVGKGVARVGGPGGVGDGCGIGYDW